MNATVQRLALALALLPFAADPALAQVNTDWIKPGVDFAESVKGGLMQIGVPILGTIMVGLGIYFGAKGQLEGMRLWATIAGGAIMMVGPSTMEALLTSFNS